MTKFGVMRFPRGLGDAVARGNNAWMKELKMIEKLVCPQHCVCACLSVVRILCSSHVQRAFLNRCYGGHMLFMQICLLSCFMIRRLSDLLLLQRFLCFPLVFFKEPFPSVQQWPYQNHPFVTQRDVVVPLKLVPHRPTLVQLSLFME